LNTAERASLAEKPISRKAAKPKHKPQKQNLDTERRLLCALLFSLRLRVKPA
jgi:hypothetical protein